MYIHVVLQFLHDVTLTDNKYVLRVKSLLRHNLYEAASDLEIHSLSCRIM